MLALEFAGAEWLALGLAVGGKQPDGVGVGLDGAGALVLGLQGAPKAPVEGQEVTAWQLTARGGRLGGRHRCPSLGCGGAAG
jgi:hypothetical protein